MSVEAAPAIPAPPRLLQIGLAVLAGLELFGALTDLTALFYDYGHTTSLLIFAQWMNSLRIALAPLILIAALVFAIRGQLRHAIVALATLMLVVWLTELPSIAIHGFELSPDVGGLLAFLKYFVAPGIAIAAMRLAMLDERLPLAGMLVALPTIGHWLGFIAFAIGIAIYGF